MTCRVWTALLGLGIVRTERTMVGVCRIKRHPSEMVSLLFRCVHVTLCTTELARTNACVFISVFTSGFVYVFRVKQYLNHLQSTRCDVITHTNSFHCVIHSEQVPSLAPPSPPHSPNCDLQGQRELTLPTCKLSLWRHNYVTSCLCYVILFYCNSAR